MNSDFVKQVISTTGLAMLMAGTAGAATITYNTNSVDTRFVGFGLILDSTSGAPATLAFTGNPDLVSGTPSNINLGAFVLQCDTCSTQVLGVGSFFAPFTFNLVVSNSANGTFVGTSSGGLVYSNVSQISINWSPLMLGPGTNNTNSGDFGTTFFTTTNFTGIVAPNSGDVVQGQTTVQGFVDSTSAVPEPATSALLGSALLGIWYVNRRRKLVGK